MITDLWDRETFVANLRVVGVRAYHDKHSFHLAMNEGRLSPESLRGWVANRFYYQRNIPIKDAAILSKTRRSVRTRARRAAAESAFAPGRLFCGGCVREFRAHSAMADRYRFVTHRAVCARSDGNATRCVRKILFMDRSARP